MGWTALWWTVIGFLSGAVPYAVVLGRLFLRRDVRRYGDGNPGSANAWKAGGWKVGLPAVLLDGFKGGIPVGLAHFLFGVRGWWLVPVALAPLLGHAFSPFLRFRGGKAVAVTFGIWLGVLLGEGPIMLGLFLLLAYAVLSTDAWAVLLTMAAFLGHLVLRGADPVLLTIGAGNMAVLLWKHRGELRRPPQLRRWLFFWKKRQGRVTPP